LLKNTSCNFLFTYNENTNKGKWNKTW